MEKCRFQITFIFLDGAIVIDCLKWSLGFRIDNVAINCEQTGRDTHQEQMLHVEAFVEYYILTNQFHKVT